MCLYTHHNIRRFDTDYKIIISHLLDKIRINPGNIGDEQRVRAVVEKAKEYGVPIRVGVNSGSLEKHLVEKYHGVTAEGLVESALDKIQLIEEMGISWRSVHVPLHTS